MSQAMNLIKGIWPDFPVTEKDLKAPSQEFLMKFFELFFDECAILDLRLQTPPDVHHPESLNGALPTISTCAFLSYISSSLRGPQVGLEDIIDPNPRKTLKLLENFANYLVYVDAHAGKLSLEAYESAIKSVTERENLMQEIDEIKGRLNEIAMKKAESAAELKKLDDKIFETDELLTSVEEQCMEGEKEVQVLADSVAAQKHRNHLLEKEIEKQNEEFEKLREKIVSSPNSISREIAELSRKKREMESDQAHLRNRAKHLAQLDSNVEQIASMIHSKLPQVDDLAASLSLLRDLENGLKEDEAAVKSAKEKYDAAVGKYQAIEKDIASADQELNDFEMKSEEELKELEESIKQALTQQEEAKHKQIEHGAQQAVLAQEVCQAEEEMEDVEKEERDFYIYFYDMEKIMYDLVRNFRKYLNDETEKIGRDL